MKGLSDTPLTFSRFLALLFVAVLVFGLIFVRLNPDRIVSGTDSVSYDLMGRQLAAGHGFTLAEYPPLLPTVYREPGYGLLVAAVYRVVGPDPTAVAYVQVLMLALAAVLVAVIGRQLFGPAAGIVGGAMFGLNSELAHYAHWLLTEIPFTLLLVIALGLALRAQRTGATHDFLATGAALGLATLMRVIAVSLAPATLLLLLVTTGRRTWRSGLVQSLMLGLGLVIVLAPWLARNFEAVGRPVLTSRFGMNLVRRAPRAAEPLSAYPDWIVASLWIATNPVSDLVYPISRFQWGPEHEDNLIWDFHVNDMVRYNRRYEPVCVPAPDPDACYAEIGMSFVRDYPLGYVLQTPFEAVLLLFAPLPGPGALIHNGLVWLGLVSAVVLARRRRLGRPHVLILGLLATYVAASVVVDTQVRYLVPVLPIFAVFAAVPATSALAAMLSRWAVGRRLVARVTWV